MKNHTIISLSLTNEANNYIAKLKKETGLSASKIVSMLISGYHQQLESDLQKYVKKESEEKCDER